MEIITASTKADIVTSEQEILSLVKDGLNKEIVLRRSDPNTANQRQVVYGVELNNAETTAFQELASRHVANSTVAKLLEANFQLICSEEAELILLASPDITEVVLNPPPTSDEIKTSISIVRQSAAAVHAAHSYPINIEGMANYLDLLSRKLSEGTKLVEQGIVSNLMANIGLSQYQTNQQQSAIEEKRRLRDMKQSDINKGQQLRGENYMNLAAALRRGQ